MIDLKDDISIVIAGEAGQGVQTVETLFMRLAKLSGLNVFATKEYMSRVRGGSNSTQIRISNTKKEAFLNRIDILVALDNEVFEHLSSRISEQTIIFADSKKITTKVNYFDIPFSAIALLAGKEIFSNTVAVGFLAALIGANKEILNFCVKEYFAKKEEEIINKNIQAAEKGFELGLEIKIKNNFVVNLSAKENNNKEVMLSGSEATALGALCGGCNFVSAYPMTPATGVFTYLSQYAKKFRIITEQAEDEIAAINMAIGAWYCGARAFVPTAGGGFALMTEGVSLSGMIETPIVIYVGQRPSPATGLPTRSEQSDLEFVLYSGHGEFPRVIFAPATVEDCFYITQNAFNIADEFQVPVFILSDQYLADVNSNTELFNFENLKIENYIVKTDTNYKRYQLTQNGISKRGIPNYGSGVVRVDSDEHDEWGILTEDLAIRKKMVEKRLAKFNILKAKVLAPKVIGKEGAKIVVVGWGSTYGAIKEAIEIINNENIKVVHFSQVYPLPENVKEYFAGSTEIIVVENNATAQFAKLLNTYGDIKATKNILKYNGSPFSVEELVEKLK